MIPPFPHQIAGAKFALNRPGSILGHEQGCGKTRSAIMAMDASQARRVLVVCPGIARGVWKAEIAKWQGFPRQVTVIYGGRADIPDRGVVIVGYELLSRGGPLVERLRDKIWDMLVCDEGHYLKELTSKRTQYIYGRGAGAKGSIAALAKRVTVLTGTPMLAHPGELYPHIRALGPELIKDRNGYVMSFQQFVARYCLTKVMWIGSRQITKISGANPSTAPELREKMRVLMHRVLKKDVLKDLPPMLWSMYPVEADEAYVEGDTLKSWRASEADLERELRGVNMSDDEAVMAALQSSRHIATTRRLTGLVKVGAAIRAIKEDLDGGTDKVLVFAHHTDVIDALDTGLTDYGVAVIDGRVQGGKFRDKVIADFQNNPDVRVFIGQNSAASTAITLTAASSVWLVEPDWTPSTNAQAAARCHRPGQRSSVTVRTVALEGSIDAIITAILTRKASDIASIIETEEV